MSDTSYDIREISSHFAIGGRFDSVAVCKHGHINDTYISMFNQVGTPPVRYVHQRVNHNVFKDVPALMSNIERVTSHLRAKLTAAGGDDMARRILTLVPTNNGSSYHVDAAGNYWRTYLFLERGRSSGADVSPGHAYEAARAFGEFVALLADLPPPGLHCTIPDFHNTPKRFAALEAAVGEDRCGRAAGAQKEIEFAMERRDIVGRFEDLRRAGEIPERITHNDTKLDNVMMDDASGSAMCVIDLDTVMPGLVLCDFGDMVRSAANSGKEDEQNLDKANFRIDIFAALLKGYVKGTGDMLLEAELDQLPFSGLLIAFEIGIRFLTDFLQGDSYFRVQRDGHNLDRCRVQFKLIRDMEREMDNMQRMLAGLTEQ